MFNTTELLLEVLKIDKNFKPDDEYGGKHGTARMRQYNVPNSKHAIIVTHSDVTKDFVDKDKHEKINKNIRIHSIEWSVSHEDSDVGGAHTTNQSEKRHIFRTGLKGTLDTIKNLVSQNPATMIHSAPASTKHRSIYHKLLNAHGFYTVDAGPDMYAWKRGQHHKDIKQLFDVSGLAHQSSWAYSGWRPGDS